MLSRCFLSDGAIVCVFKKSYYKQSFFITHRGFQAVSFISAVPDLTACASSIIGSKCSVQKKKLTLKQVPQIVCRQSNSECKILKFKNTNFELILTNVRIAAS